MEPEHEPDRLSLGAPYSRFFVDHNFHGPQETLDANLFHATASNLWHSG